MKLDSRNRPDAVDRARSSFDHDASRDAQTNSVITVDIVKGENTVALCTLSSK